MKLLKFSKNKDNDSDNTPRPALQDGRIPKGKHPAEKVKKAKKGKKRKKGFVLFRNMKIAPRMLLGFLVIALIGTGMGLYASIGLNNTSAAGSQMYKEMLLPLRNITTLQQYLQDERVSLRSMLIETDTDRYALYKSTISRCETNVRQSFSMLDGLVSKETKPMLDEVSKSYEAFSALVLKAYDTIVAGDKQSIAQDLLKFGNLYQAESSISTAVEHLITATTDGSTRMDTANKKNAETTMAATFGLTGLVLLLSALIGLTSARSISRPMKKLTNSLSLLAAGETDIPATGIDSKNEIGQMNKAVVSIIKSVDELASDTDLLINAALAGELSTRADADKHQGAYRRIIEGFNTTLDTVVSPVQEAASVLSELAQGNLDVAVNGEFKGDHAIIKNALNETISNLKFYIGEISETLGNIAEGNLETGITAEFKGNFAELKDSLNKSIEAFNSVLADINLAAEQVATGTTQVSSGSQEISQGATEQASAIEELTATIATISEQTKNNAETANQANALSISAKEDAGKGNAKIQDMQKAMADINEASASIKKIIKVIDDIAFQTNMLALNAAVEAARAGVHGKGFAVVAEEVRNLAGRSAKAAQETTELIESSIKKAGAGTQIAEDTAVALQNIMNVVEKTVVMMGEIALSTNEQAQGIAQINRGIEQMSMVVQNNSATAEEAAASTEELSGQAELLKNMVKRFRLKGSQTEPLQLNSGDPNAPVTEPAR